MIQVLSELAAGKPFLGICLGMQALLEESEENDGTHCLGLLRGRVVRFPEGLEDAAGNSLKIPHMGWNRSTRPAPIPCGRESKTDSWFYFVHSYYASPDDSSGDCCDH